jgi:phosphoglycolate phosphatase
MIRVFRPIPVERLKLLVFDLDGTLIDSAQDLCNSVNETLKHFGRAPLPDPQIASFVGNGVSILVRRSLATADGTPSEGVDEKLLDDTLNFFIGYYREHKLDFTYAYEGVIEALAALRELHYATGSVTRVMAVLTNKPVNPARGICAGLGMADYFLHIYGGNSFPTKKPDPLGLRSLMEETGAAPEDTVMIGDSRVDVETARNAGVWSLGCNFGFGPRNLMETPPDVLVDTPAEWIEALIPRQAARNHAGAAASSKSAD